MNIYQKSNCCSEINQPRINITEQTKRLNTNEFVFTGANSIQ